MFATGPAKRLECLSQVTGGVYLAPNPRTLTSWLSSTIFLATDVLPVSGETNADSRVAPDSDS
jgi:hypothetical protein